MKWKKIGKLTALGCLFALRAIGADVSVTMTIDRNQISIEESLEVQVQVEGARSGDPQILGAEKFAVEPSGTSSQFQMINGSVSQSISYGFVLTPKEPGLFKIGPARVTVDGKNYESETFEVSVSKSGASSGANPRSAATGEGAYFNLVNDVSSQNCFQGQQILYTLKFFHRAGIANAQFGFPEFKGFLKEGPDQQRAYEAVIQGVKWNVAEVRFVLFPVSSGSVTIEPARITGDVFVQTRRRTSLFDDFFGGRETRRINLQSEPRIITVSPLPVTGRPASFQGLVGQFSIQASLNKSTVAVGDSMTLTATIAGNGNLRDFALPKMETDQFKVYDDQPSFEFKPSGNDLWKGSKVFKRALVPLKAGSHVVPPLTFTYFDPALKTYRLETVKLSEITATGSGDESLNHTAGVEMKRVEVLGQDLMPNKRTPSALRFDSLKQGERGLLSLILLSLGAIYAALFIFKKKSEAQSTKLGYRRKKMAFKEFQVRLKEFESNECGSQEASAELRTYLGNKLNLDGKAITPSEAERKLKVHGLTAGTIQRIGDFLAHCEKSDYGGGGENRDYKNEMLQIVHLVEKEVRS